ncbi:MAG: hypothetical protein ACXWW9_04335 [Actinomycetota bacterium]
MEATRTHQGTQGQSLWSWVLIGAVGLTAAVAIVLALQTNTDGGSVTVRAPAQVQPQAQVEPSFKDDVLHGRGLVDVKIGATKFTPPSTAIREGGTYYEAQEATVTPRRGPCATKQGC